MQTCRSTAFRKEMLPHIKASYQVVPQKQIGEGGAQIEVFRSINYIQNL
jgi:hypothetical protein